jgi:hypothetical protein
MDPPVFRIMDPLEGRVFQDHGPPEAVLGHPHLFKGGDGWSTRSTACGKYLKFFDARTEGRDSSPSLGARLDHVTPSADI